jgi:ArsR family transcriptional regulator
MFRVMSAPTRLKIISHLCEGEKNVSELIALIKTTQPNISQHLNTLHQAGIVGRRRAGVQIYYHIANDRIVALCRSLCGIVSAEAQIPHP